MRNPKWAREEVILTLDLYFKLDNADMHARNPAVIELSGLLNSLKIHQDRPDALRFRNANGVALKLANFMSLDPDYHGKGMVSASKLDREVFNEFYGRRVKLSEISREIKSNASGEAVGPALKLKKVSYDKLNSRQKETYNFQKVSAVLAEYGFATIPLNDDWQGADFIAQHLDGSTYLKVQLKSRLSFHKKYVGKEIWVCFPYKAYWYLYPHDDLLDTFLLEYADTMAKSASWKENGFYTWKTLSAKNADLLKPFRI